MNRKVRFSKTIKEHLLKVIMAGGFSLLISIAGIGKPFQATAKGFIQPLATALDGDYFPGLPISTVPSNDLILDVTNFTSDTNNITDPTSIVLGDCDSNQGEASAWYNYTPTEDINLLFDTIDSNYDTVLAIWTGTVGDLTLVACNDDISLFQIQSKVGLRAHAGTEYYIEVIEFAQPSARVQELKTLHLHVDYMPEDTIPPSVVSITRADFNPTKDATVTFDVTFSEDVVGVGSGDFKLTSTGSLNGTYIGSVSGSGVYYTVTASTGSGVGSLRLDIDTTATITDFVLNPLSSLPYTNGQAYSVRTQTFADVPISHWAWQYIERLYAAGITGGCALVPLQYCPTNTVTRDQMAVFLLKAKYGKFYAPPPATGTMFNDVPANYWAANWIEQLAREGITSGCGGGNYCPTNPVTRDQMAVFLLKSKHGTTYIPPAASGDFFDVPVSYWAAAWIEQLAFEGITGGCGGGNYCPTSPVTRDQMAVFLVKTFSLP